jgi:hypothetical protein
MKLIAKPVCATLADILANLSAGWLGLILIAPGFTGYPTLTEISLIVFRNLPPAIISFIIAVYLRRG